MTDDYKETVKDVYAQAALAADPALCCVAGTQWAFPDLDIPPILQEMNYGCGSTVHPADLLGELPILYVGVGGGLEALQFAYFRRRPGGVIAIDPVAEMRDAARRNLELAAHSNPWFDPAFVTILDGTAEALPVADGSAGVVAQNCLFNVFVDRDLQQALAEVHRVLAVGGRFSTSDPITTEPLPRALTENRTLRARCIAGCISYERYLKALHGAGFQQLVVRARRPYRLLLPSEFAELSQPILLESLEVLALKTEAHKSEPDVYCGRHAIYLGSGSYEHAGLFTFHRGVPVPVADGLASALSQRADFTVTAPTFAARGVGCC
jgi:ubiquinone/menaquinone biosynthesis C-methylase UbiE